MNSLFPRFPAVYLAKLYAADFVELFYGDWKTEAWYLAVSDETDYFPASISGHPSAVSGNRRYYVCRTDCRFNGGYSRNDYGMAGIETKRIS